MHRGGSTGKRVLAATLVGAAFAVLLAACGGSPSTPSATKTTSKATTTTSTTVPGAKLVPYNKYKNARLDVTLDGACTQNSQDDWVLKGMLINPDPKNITSFSIVVDYVHEPGSTVLNTVIVNVPKVAPKKTVPWQSSWEYSGKSVSCVVRQAQVTSS